MPWKYKDSRKPYHSGERFYLPRRSMGLRYAWRQKKLVRQRAAMNKKIALSRLKAKYFTYVPRIPSYGRGSFFAAKRKYKR